MHRLVDQRLVEIVAHRIAVAVGQLGCAGQLAQLVEGHVHLGRNDVRAAAALEMRLLGRPADHGDALRAAQRQQAVVLEQDDAFAGRPAGQGMVGRSVELAAFGRRLGLENNGEYPPHGFVEVSLVQLAAAHGLDHGLHPALSRAGHLQIQPALQRLDPVVHRAPVGHHQAFEAPLVLEDIDQQLVVLGAVGSVELVVGAHHRPGPGLFDHRLERRQVDLAEGALVDQGVDAKALVFLVVGREVLERRAYTGALHAVDEAGGQLAGQEGILGEVLEIAAAQGGALHVDAGSQQHVDAQRRCLLTQRLTHLADERRIPGGRQA